jgi:hypothetical protein
MCSGKELIHMAPLLADLWGLRQRFAWFLPLRLLVEKKSFDGRALAGSS